MTVDADVPSHPLLRHLPAAAGVLRHRVPVQPSREPAKDGWQQLAAAIQQQQLLGLAELGAVVIAALCSDCGQTKIAGQLARRAPSVRAERKLAARLGEHLQVVRATTTTGRRRVRVDASKLQV